MSRVGPYSRAGVLARLDGRSKEARLVKYVVRDLTAQVVAVSGGDPTPAQEMRIRNIAMMELRKSQLEAKLLTGRGFIGTEHDQQHYVAVCNSIDRALHRLEIGSDEPDEPPSPTVSLADYLAKRAAEAAS